MIKDFILPCCVFATTGVGTAAAQVPFDPNAGIVPSHTVDAELIASSNAGALAPAFDGDPNTHWQSGGALPYGYLGVPSQNVAIACSGDALTDGDPNTAVEVSGTRRIEFTPQPLTAVSIKANTPGSLSLKLLAADGESTELGSVAAADNFQVKTFDVPAGTYEGIEVSSDGSAVQIFELAALTAEVYEWAGALFPEPRAVGQIWLRSWPGDTGAEATIVEGTADGETWTELAETSPEALQMHTVVLPEEKLLLGVRVAHRVKPVDWSKVMIWELQVYDRHGPYGPVPDQLDEAVTLAEMLGVNGIWGWGYNQFSDQLDAQQGPARFARVFAKARNYHNLDWDITGPDEAPDYLRMAKGGGTQAMEWMNWDREYATWRGAGLEPNPTVRITTFEEALWTEPAAQAERWGRAFGKHFGQGMIGSVEVGNEPWTFTAPGYRAILDGAVKGLRAAAGDTLRILPCALQAVDSATEKTTYLRNYIGGRISPETLAQLDGLNAHTYAFVSNPDGARTETYPENPAGAWGELHNMLRWRNANAPGLPVYLTEFGYDSPGAKADCDFSECVSEEEAAAYTLRSVLIANRLGIRRADYYFYGNTDGEGLFTRSGLVGLPATGAEEKLTFEVLARLRAELGDYRFTEVIQEDETLYAYRFSDTEGGERVVAWRPRALTARATPAGDSPEALAGVAAVYSFDPQGTPASDLSGWPQVYE